MGLFAYEHISRLRPKESENVREVEAPGVFVLAMKSGRYLCRASYSIVLYFMVRA